MGTNYTDQDTERVRQTQGSSAGQPTQPLVGAGQPSAPLAPDRGKNNLVALALIAVGILILLGRLGFERVDVMPGIVLLTIGSCLLFFSFWRRIYGLLIPGAILAGLSIGVTFADLTGGASVLWGLSLGFLAVLFLGRALFNVRNTWPLYPAIPLFGVGVIVAASQLPTLLAGGMVWFPLLLIAAGLFLGWGRRRWADQRQTNKDE